MSSSGFIGPIPPLKGHIFNSKNEAFDAWHTTYSATHGVPIYIGPDPITKAERWLIPQPIARVDDNDPKGMSIEDYRALKSRASGPPSPGSAANAARLKHEDKVKIADRERKAAEKRKVKAEKQAEAERRQQAQRSLFE